MSDKPVKVCPKCKARKVEKLISHTSFQLKGGGWYSDLYGSQKPTTSAGTTESSSEKSTSTPAASSDKPSAATPSESKEKGKGKKNAAKVAA